jgi:hypothetical protein
MTSGSPFLYCPVCPLAPTHIRRLRTVLLRHLIAASARVQALAYDLFFGYMEEQGVSPLIVGALAKCMRPVLRSLWAATAGLLQGTTWGL